MVKRNVGLKAGIAVGLIGLVSSISGCGHVFNAVRHEVEKSRNEKANLERIDNYERSLMEIDENPKSPDNAMVIIVGRWKDMNDDGVVSLREMQTDRGGYSSMEDVAICCFPRYNAGNDLKYTLSQNLGPGASIVDEKIFNLENERVARVVKKAGSIRPGNYRVDFSLDGKPFQSIPITIK